LIVLARAVWIAFEASKVNSVNAGAGMVVFEVGGGGTALSSAVRSELGALVPVPFIVGPDPKKGRRSMHSR
jgi:hypothetical protein